MKAILIRILYFLLIIALLGCEENNYYIIAEDLGEVSIYIEGNLTDEEAASQLADELGSATREIYVQNTTQLTTLNIHSDTNIRKIEFYNNQKLANITISGFKKVSELLFKENNTLPYPANPISLNCNDIEEVASTLDLKMYYTAEGATINFNKLKTIGPQGFTLWAKCNQLNFPLLESVKGFSFAVAKDVVTFPSLKYIDYIYGPTYIEFSQLNFPALETCNHFDFSPDQYINTAQITLPQLSNCEFFRLTKTIGNSDGINTILHQFLTVFPTSGKYILLATNFPSIPPTGQGLIDKQTLINQENTVSTD